jgi:uncharacterized cupredoxin-like copper-binding protein
MRHLWVVTLILLMTACSAPASTAEPEPQIVTLTASDIAFDQSTIEVVAGQPVKLIYTNTGTLDHDFSVDQIDVDDVSDEGGHHHQHDGDLPDLHLGIEPGGTAILRFTPTTSGTYTFICTIEGHREADGRDIGGEMICPCFLHRKT